MIHFVQFDKKILMFILHTKKTIKKRGHHFRFLTTLIRKLGGRGSAWCDVTLKVI